MSAIARRATGQGNRVGLAILLVMASILALGSFWVLEVMRKQFDDSQPAVVRKEPDYFVENFNFVRMSTEGLAQYNISGKKMLHFPEDDTHTIDLPVVNSLSKDRPPMTSTAKRGMVDQNNSKVHMYENANIDRPATPTSDHFHLSSEYLLILPDEDIIQTDKPVEITLGTSKLTGTGMIANNATRQLHLASNVHATYQPPATAGAR